MTRKGLALVAGAVLAGSAGAAKAGEPGATTAVPEILTAIKPAAYEALSAPEMAAVVGSSIAEFTGRWINLDSNTGGVTQLQIVSQAGNPAVLGVQAWGRCHPTDCDWGQATGFAYGPNVSADIQSTALAATADFSTSFSETLMVLLPVGADRLLAEVFTRFKDGSGRSPYGSVYSFARTQ